MDIDMFQRKIIVTLEKLQSYSESIQVIDFYHVHSKLLHLNPVFLVKIEQRR